MFTRFCLWVVLLYMGGGKLPFLFADSLPLSPQATVSVLTCAPGTETYALFGHSALRITDPLRGFDRVYNYGTFDFATPNFYGRFMRGDLQYFLSVNSFAEFLSAYRQENRVVSEQVLALQPPEAQRLYTYLETTLHSSARFYRYQFFADNCTTRLWRDIHASVETPLQVDSAYARPARSYRQLLVPYLAPAPWVNLGMNLGLGWPADDVPPTGVLAGGAPRSVATHAPGAPSLCRARAAPVCRACPPLLPAVVVDPHPLRAGPGFPAPARPGLTPPL